MNLTHNQRDILGSAVTLLGLAMIVVLVLCL